MPRTRTPPALNGEDASAWPSTMGAASLMPLTAEMRPATSSQSVERLFQRLDQEMAVEAENLVEQLAAKAVHHRHDDDQGGDAEHDAEEGESGNDRDESLLAPRPQIAQRQHPFERREGPRPIGLGHLDWVPRLLRVFTRSRADSCPVCRQSAFAGTQEMLPRRSRRRRRGAGRGAAEQKRPLGGITAERRRLFELCLWLPPSRPARSRKSPLAAGSGA